MNGFRECVSAFPEAFLISRDVRGSECRLGAVPKWGVWLRRLVIYKIANSPLQGSDSAILRDAILVKRPFWQSPQPTPPSSHCVLAKGKTGRRLQVGVVEGGEEVTQRLGREADGNYVCLALCTGRKRWLIPFGETFVFTIFYSFVYF